jgi:transglutaminase-like putative cysteine protease
LKKYLAASQYIDWQQPDVLAKAQSLAEGKAGDEAIARACFEFVRDEIKHSWDYQANPVTCKASDVLKYGTGYCYAKSHLLAALLRANNIPAGLCYQRLTISNDQPPFCLHGLNAVYLQKYGWYRIDPRGNKEGVNADFIPPQEQLAFAIKHVREADLAGIWPEPMAVVVDVLTAYADVLDVAQNLPDIELTLLAKA